MEKLKAAIDQARKARTDSEASLAPTVASVEPQAEATTPAPQVDTPARPEPVPAENAPKGLPADPASDQDAPQGLDELWQNLTPLKIKRRRFHRHRLVADTPGVNCAPFDMLRTRLLTQMKKEGWRRVLVTSPTKACGKSTTCSNLALSLSRHPDLRTIVFEADFRRPSMAKMFGAPSGKGFSDVLEGKVSFADQALRLGDNVALSFSHAVTRDPAELLQSRRTAEVLDEIEETYKPDLMIFDMPPLLANDDTLGFVKNVDCALLLAMAEQSTFADLDVCEADLAAHTNVAGIILNRCRYTGGQYGYQYGS